MKGFSYPDISPLKQEKKSTGPRAEKEEESVKEHNTKARMHNVMEIKERQTNPSISFRVTEDNKLIRRGRMPKPQQPKWPQMLEYKKKK